MCQFHQRYYVQIFCTNLVLAAFSSYVLALAKKFVQKMCANNVDEIDTIMSFYFSVDLKINVQCRPKNTYQNCLPTLKKSTLTRPPTIGCLRVRCVRILVSENKPQH